jgi:hypothetical protein
MDLSCPNSIVSTSLVRTLSASTSGFILQALQKRKHETELSLPLQLGSMGLSLMGQFTFYFDLLSSRLTQWRRLVTTVLAVYAS